MNTLLHRFLPGFLTVVVLVPAVVGQQHQTITFGKTVVGQIPAGWKVDRTGEGKGSEWKVVADETAPSKSNRALAQLAESPRAMFNLCIAETLGGKDVELRVAFKAISGKVDQGGGVVWRYQDANNYYIARANPLELNYRVYKVVNGKRIQLATKEELTMPANTWHTLKIQHVGDRIECSLNGQKHLEAKDDAIPKAGKVGLWTKADARTHFDKVELREVGK